MTESMVKCRTHGQARPFGARSLMATTPSAPYGPASDEAQPQEEEIKRPRAAEPGNDTGQRFAEGPIVHACRTTRWADGVIRALAVKGTARDSELFGQAGAVGGTCPVTGPPSTTNSEPVEKLPSSLARNITSRATSSASPMRGSAEGRAPGRAERSGPDRSARSSGCG